MIICKHMNCSLPGSSARGILQARILDWVAKPFSRGPSDLGIKPRSPALQAVSLSSETSGKLYYVTISIMLANFSMINAYTYSLLICIIFFRMLLNLLNYLICIHILFFFFYLWWILSYIEMKQPWVHMCSPSQSPLPPPSPPIPSRFSQCTRSERLSHASNLGWWSVSP